MRTAVQVLVEQGADAREVHQLGPRVAQHSVHQVVVRGPSVVLPEDILRMVFVAKPMPKPESPSMRQVSF